MMIMRTNISSLIFIHFGNENKKIIEMFETIQN